MLSETSRFINENPTVNGFGDQPIKFEVFVASRMSQFSTGGCLPYCKMCSWLFSNTTDDDDSRPEDLTTSPKSHNHTSSSTHGQVPSPSSVAPINRVLAATKPSPPDQLGSGERQLLPYRMTETPQHTEHSKLLRTSRQLDSPTHQGLPPLRPPRKSSSHSISLVTSSTSLMLSSSMLALSTTQVSTPTRVTSVALVRGPVNPEQMAFFQNRSLSLVDMYIDTSEPTENVGQIQ
ncbi:uncharacterized protein LOC121872207, partial [Homarus americanus]|uniref:uncharacterized protein LOC121872207 n=1 Tax=Homarus americanus TaxID=6706 RepID=UPI001C476DB0